MYVCMLLGSKMVGLNSLLKPLFHGLNKAVINLITTIKQVMSSNCECGIINGRCFITFGQFKTSYEFFVTFTSSFIPSAQLSIRMI